MVDAKRLLADLKRLARRLHEDLRRHHAASAGRVAVQAEWQAARDAGRTADTFDTFFTAEVDQAAVHWILALVFLRFLEDNRLIDRPLIAGPGERLELAQLRMREHFATRPKDSEAEYLLAVFGEVARLPGLAGLYDEAHNPLFRLPVSGDGAVALLDFFRARDPETGELVHDFADLAGNTRFLGDLYQDLSEEARKRFALLQTPDFVEDWILSRTLDPALAEFGIEQVRMIDPACGSGHFLLGGFARLVQAWRGHAPELPPAALAQRALDAVAGVDLNPFAIEIARFRLLVEALKVAGETRLSAAPDFRFRLAAGDSLLHGRHFFRRELGGTDEGFRRVLRHHYAAEDTVLLDAVLGRQYHAVVGNPPYITPKDAAMRGAYREIYASCHRVYGLGAPFTERFFDLALEGSERQAAGFVGLIVANSFMKREFGKKLIEKVLPRLDVTHVVDCSGVAIAGHGTPTVILFGRNQSPVAPVVRTIRGVRGGPAKGDSAMGGLVWLAIVAQADIDASLSDFISTEDTPREILSRHPWAMGGDGAADVIELIARLSDRVVAEMAFGPIGGAVRTGMDDIFTYNSVRARLSSIPTSAFRNLLTGEYVRDWFAETSDKAFYPYAMAERASPERELWQWRTGLAKRTTFQGIMADAGLAWIEYMQHTAATYKSALSITFAFVATHNHFVLDRGGKVFKQSAPVIKFPAEASEDDHLGLLGLLNSSTACFWLQQVCHNKGGPGGGSSKDEKWHDFYEISGTAVGNFPLSDEQPVELARALDSLGQKLAGFLPASLCGAGVPNRKLFDAARAEVEDTRSRMIALQEELDWRCYRLYGLIDDSLEYPDPPPLRVGERAFEFVLARRVHQGVEATKWFTWLGVAEKTELPVEWPEDYRNIVQRRMESIESNTNISLIERQSCKRRWEHEPWDKLERSALREWLLDRLEDPRYWPAHDPRVLSSLALADAARYDDDFLSVAALHAGRADFDLEALVAELVAAESVPFLAALRYTESGLRKRADWEATWDKQRAEDAIDADLAARRDEFLREAWTVHNPRREGEEDYAQRTAGGLKAAGVQKTADAAIAREAKRRKAEEVGDIPVPPKYSTPDFQSQTFWRLRGGLDVPKERFMSLPHCARDADPSLPVLWAGHDHLARANAIAAWYVERRETDGWGAERLAPLLAGLLELVPWLRQWHNEVAPESGLRMGDFYAEYVENEARDLGLTLDDLRAWTPPAPARKRRGRRAPE